MQLINFEAQACRLKPRCRIRITGKGGHVMRPNVMDNEQNLPEMKSSSLFPCLSLPAYHHLLCELQEVFRQNDSEAVLNGKLLFLFPELVSLVDSWIFQEKSDQIFSCRVNNPSTRFRHVERLHCSCGQTITQKMKHSRHFCNIAMGMGVGWDKILKAFERVDENFWGASRDDVFIRKLCADSFSFLFHTQCPCPDFPTSRCHKEVHDARAMLSIYGNLLISITGLS